MNCQEAFLYMPAINSYICIFREQETNPAYESVSHPSEIAPSASVLRAVCYSMKKGFAVNPDLTSMPLMYLGRISQEWIAMGMLREIDVLGQLNLTLIFCLVLSFLCFVLFASVSSLFQIDTNKSITQKRLKKVSEPVPILSF